VVEEKIEELKATLGIKSKASPVDGHTVSGNAFRGGRWISPEKVGSAEEGKRSELVYRFLHAGCELVLSNLVQEGNYWCREINTDKENPLGNSFESLMHLVANFSGAEFNVYLSQVGPGILAVQTNWMSAGAPLYAPRCRL
jgi:hypothetical protein